jgi:hypothetical protein
MKDEKINFEISMLILRCSQYYKCALIVLKKRIVNDLISKVELVFIRLL